jgi:hypothetical protein
MAPVGVESLAAIPIEFHVSLKKLFQKKNAPSEMPFFSYEEMIRNIGFMDANSVWNSRKSPAYVYLHPRQFHLAQVFSNLVLCLFLLIIQFFI